jgi:hypothetical protein
MGNLFLFFGFQGFALTHEHPIGITPAHATLVRDSDSRVSTSPSMFPLRQMFGASKPPVNPAVTSAKPAACVPGNDTDFDEDADDGLLCFACSRTVNSLLVNVSPAQ